MSEAFETEAIVFVVDDDPSMRKALSNLFRSVGLRAEVFGSAREWLENKLPEVASCLVLDIRLPGPSGLDFQAELAKTNIQIPIIFMTGHGDIPMTVKAMKAGAVDFLTKPFRDQDMLDAVAVAIERDRTRRKEEKIVAELRSVFETLTPRERDVLALVASGLMNKQIAAEIGLAEITVKISSGAPHAKNGRKVVGRSGQNGRNARNSAHEALAHQNLSMIFPRCVAEHCGGAPTRFVLCWP